MLTKLNSTNSGDFVPSSPTVSVIYKTRLTRSKICIDFINKIMIVVAVHSLLSLANGLS